MTTIADRINDLHKQLLGLNAERMIASSRGDPKPVSIASIPVPGGDLVEKATQFARETVEESVFNHSLRAFYFGEIVGKDQFPDLLWDSTTLYLSCILHDIGMGNAKVPSSETSVMSFEFDGALKAREFLISHGCEKKMADTVFEAIARQTDLYQGGKRPEATLMTIGTMLDVGSGSELIHPDSVHEVIVKCPRLDVRFKASELLQYEVDSKNRQCHATYILDVGLLEVLAGVPMFAAYDK